jgi:hypothetical protein
MFEPSGSFTMIAHGNSATGCEGEGPEECTLIFKTAVCCGGRIIFLGYGVF